MEKEKMAIVILVLVVVVALGYIFWAPSEGLDVGKISSEVSSEEAVLLDVRTPEELQSDGYASGSTHFELARLENGELPDYDKDMKIYTYCKSGGRAGKAKDILEENGFTNVTNIGGLVDWESAGGEVVMQ